MKFYLDIPFTFPGNILKTFDLIVPEGKAADIPLLIWIHGGAWCGGEKRIFNDFERFVFRGYAVLSIDYRFSHEAIYPAQLEDCKTAIRWARAHAESYGYNAEKIIVGGSSAGGHLATLLGITNGETKYDVGLYKEYSSSVQGVVDLFGPSDLRNLPTLQDDIDRLTNKDDDLLETASPVCYEFFNVPDFLIVHGQDDPLVPVEQSRRLKKLLDKAGVPVEYVEIPKGIHGFDCVEFYDVMNKFIKDHK